MARKSMEDIEWKIVNIVCQGNIHRRIILENVAEKLGNSEYDPHNFPGLVVRLGYPPAVFLVFASGKLICTGLKDLNKVGTAFKELNKMLEGF